MTCGTPVASASAPAPAPAPEPEAAPVQPQPQEEKKYTGYPPNYVPPAPQPEAAPAPAPSVQPQPVPQPAVQSQAAPGPQAAPAGKPPKPPKAPKPPKVPKQPSQGGRGFGFLMMIIIGALIVLALMLGVIGIVVNGIKGVTSSDKAEGSGTALTQLLDDAAMTHYNGSGTSNSKPSSNSGDTDHEEATSEDTDSGSGSPGEVIGPNAEDSKYIGNQYVGSYETVENDYMTMKIADGWYGMDNHVDGKFDGFGYAPGNGPGGHLGAFVYHDQEYTDSVVDDQIKSTKEYRFDSSADVEDIEINGIKLRGIEGVEDIFGDKQVTRMYWGIVDGNCLIIEFNSDDEKGEIFRESALWFMIYSITVK